MSVASARRPALAALADRIGVLPEFVDQGGRVRRTRDASRMALLEAMGLDAASETGARRTLAALDAAERDRLIAAVRIVPAGTAGLGVPVRWPRRGSLRWTIEVTDEGGAVHAESGRAEARGGRALLGPLRVRPRLGYHQLRVTVTGGGVERVGTQRVIAVPQRCPTVGDVLGDRRVFGLCANLYAVRSERGWGIGDATDLARLVTWAREIGAAFVGVNPLHALRARGDAVSPYDPVSRLYRNVLYLDPTAVPELAESPAARALVASPAVRAELATLRAARLVDYGPVLAVKERVCSALHATFVERHRGRETPRGRAYAAFVAREGQPLSDFATYLALEASLGARGRWPAAYRNPRGPAVEAFRAEHADVVDRHRYLQFELDRQLGAAAGAAGPDGLAIGVYQDLAIGSARTGSDTWAFPGLFVDGVAVGAPPDPYSAMGQDWGFPPVDPRALAADGYRYWTLLLRSALRHAGALRIDHVMGLFRQFWIPRGGAARDGVYVRFPAEDLLGILALEATRAGALVVGEDLGTVPPGLPRVLARWGILSSRVLYFERSRDGRFRPAARYPARALVTANTHDQPPLAGWWAGRDLVARRAAGHIASETALARLERGRRREREALVARLVAEGLLPRGTATPSGPELRSAVHAMLCRTPAALVGVWLDDLTGEVDAVNLPGVGPEGYPSWRRRLGLPLETMPDDPDVRRALAGTRSRARRASSAA